MITTDRNINQFSLTCECGNEIHFATNQPTGDEIRILCECFTSHRGIIPEGNTGYRMHQATRRIREGIIDIFQDIGRSMTVRQLYYQAVSRDIVDKDEKGYGIIQRNVLNMRRYGHLPYSFIADLSRRRVKPNSYKGMDDALDKWMKYYRQDVWSKQPHHVEIWLEKDALSGIFAEITTKYDVPLYIARGFSSESFLYDASLEIKEIGKPAYIYYFSDYDPSGLEMCKQVKKRLPLFGVNINFIRAGLTYEQIIEHNLPSRPTKKTKHSIGFNDESTELDALHPDELQELIESCILNHISEQDLKNIEMEETVQRQTLEKFRNNFRLA